MKRIRIWYFITLCFYVKCNNVFCNKEEWQNVAELEFKRPVNDDIPAKLDDNLRSDAILRCDMLAKLLNQIPLTALIKEEEEEYVHLKLKFKAGELQILKDYTNGYCQFNSDVMKVMNRAIRNVEIIPVNQFSLLTVLYEFLYHNQELVSLVTVTILVFSLLLWWWTFSKSWMQVAVRGFVLLFILSTIWNWTRMYKNAISEKESILAKSGNEIPIECRPHDMTYVQSFIAWYKGTFTLSEDQCGKYYKHYIVDPFWDANPMTAASDTLSKMLLQPLSVLGEYIGLFIKQMFLQLPVQLWFPVGFITCFFIFLGVVMYFRYRIRLPFFLLSLEPGEPRHQITSSNTAVTTTICNSCSRITSASSVQNVNATITPITELTPISTIDQLQETGEKTKNTEKNITWVENTNNDSSGNEGLTLPSNAVQDTRQNEAENPRLVNQEKENLIPPGCKIREVTE